MSQVESIDKRRLACRVCSGLVLAAVLATAAASAPSLLLADLVWLAGCWQSERAEPGSGEQWMAPAGGLMLGTARSIREGRAVSFEFMRIDTSEGSPVFIAQPQGGKATVFGLLNSEAQSVSFENMQHDFPQRVSYLREGDRLLATIAGIEDGAMRELSFPMRRMSCDEFSR